MSKQSKSVVAYIIVCWNNRDILEECIESINKQTYKNKQIVVVDNGSSDDSVSFLKSNYPGVEVIATGKNNGFSIANNIGIKHALEDPACKYFALINTDARIAPDWTQTLVDFAENNSRVSSMQAPTLDYYDHSIYDSFGITVDGLGRAVQIGYMSKKAPTKHQQVFGVNFAAGMITRDFIEAQPFDDYLDKDIWMYLDDVDFAARATVMGWKNWLVVGSQAYHMGSATSNKNPGFSVFMSYRNNFYMILKNFPILIAIQLILGAVVADAISYYQLLRGKNYVAIKSIIRGRFTSLFHLGTFLRKRKDVMSRRNISYSKLRDLMGPKSFSMSD